MNSHTICVLGGTGFVGRRVLEHLARSGHRLRVVTRRREAHRELLVLPGLELLQGDIHYVSDLIGLFKGCDVVINLVGILNAGKGGAADFQRVHADLPAKVVEACRFNGIKRLLHMGALRANAEGPSDYLRSKAAGEEVVMAAGANGMQVTAFRPSVIFGPGDQFLNRFAQLLRVAPFMPLPGANARFSPVFVDDVARAFADSIDQHASYGRAYDLCGPDTYALKDLVKLTGHSIGCSRPVLPLGAGLARLQARIMEKVPGKPLTRDNLLSMQLDSVCSQNGLPELGIKPTALEAVVPYYLGNGARSRWYDRLRSAAGR